MANKRLKKRHRKRMPLRFGIDRPVKIGYTDDVHHDGLFIRSAVVARPGVKLLVEMELPEGMVALIGEVRWTKKVPSNMAHKMKAGMGVLIQGFLAGEEIYRSLCDELVEHRGD